jgi:hypothetical protein
LGGNFGLYARELSNPWLGLVRPQIRSGIESGDLPAEGWYQVSSFGDLEFAGYAGTELYRTVEQHVSDGAAFALEKHE